MIDTNKESNIEDLSEPHKRIKKVAGDNILKICNQNNKITNIPL